jgi:DNA topoisomerase VI subunit A
VATRRFLVRLYREFQLPPLTLVDADPHGISIMAVYRFGSQVSSHYSIGCTQLVHRIRRIKTAKNIKKLFNKKVNCKLQDLNIDFK